MHGNVLRHSQCVFDVIPKQLTVLSMGAWLNRAACSQASGLPIDQLALCILENGDAARTAAVLGAHVIALLLRHWEFPTHRFVTHGIA